MKTLLYVLLVYAHWRDRALLAARRLLRTYYINIRHSHYLPLVIIGWHIEDIIVLIAITLLPLLRYAILIRYSHNYEPYYRCHCHCLFCHYYYITLLLEQAIGYHYGCASYWLRWSLLLPLHYIAERRIDYMAGIAIIGLEHWLSTAINIIEYYYYGAIAIGYYNITGQKMAATTLPLLPLLPLRYVSMVGLIFCYYYCYCHIMSERHMAIYCYIMTLLRHCYILSLLTHCWLMVTRCCEKKIIKSARAITLHYADYIIEPLFTITTLPAY